MNPETVLSIEAAIAGGSLALLRDGAVVDKWHGDGGVSRSEELLPRIAEMLAKNGIEKREVARIAVSNGPGSYTGIRIGLATAMGLAKALSIPCVGVSLLAAVSRTFPTPNDAVVVLPIGREGFCWQRFRRGSTGVEAGQPESGKLADLLGLIASSNNFAVLAHRDAHAAICGSKDFTDEPDRLVDIGRDMAVLCSLSSGSFDDGLEPFYASDTSYKPVGNIG